MGLGQRTQSFVLEVAAPPAVSLILLPPVLATLDSGYPRFWLPLFLLPLLDGGDDAVAHLDGADGA